MKQKKQRRIASNLLITPEKNELIQHVITLEESCVVSIHPLEKEEANTEWLQGSITLKKESAGVRAYYQGKLLT